MDSIIETGRLSFSYFLFQDNILGARLRVRERKWGKKNICRSQTPKCPSQDRIGQPSTDSISNLKKAPLSSSALASGKMWGQRTGEDVALLAGAATSVAKSRSCEEGTVYQCPHHVRWK